MNPTVKPLPIGISDYKKIIENGCYYVDKTLLIQELLATKDEITLLCRPRRFGKTINLSMLQYFFEKTSESHGYLFTDKLIWQDERMREHQGRYPVIFISFKDVKEKTFKSAYNSILNLIVQEYRRHEAFVALHLTAYEAKKYQDILHKTANDTEYSDTLFFLSELLHRIYGKPVMVFLDEYDAPIHTAYIHGYYREMVDFIKIMLGRVLKDNVHLERGVLTGILRTAKKGIFSGLNNLTVCTFLSNQYTDKFGFTESEVTQLLTDQQVAVPVQDITAWYNGYRAGDSTLLYNPWSIVQCAKNKGELRPYWVNTSDNKLIETLIARANQDVKIELEAMVQGGSITKIIDESFTLAETEYDDSMVWSLLLFSGYVTYAHRTLNAEGIYEYALVVPNRELRGLYKNLIRSILKQVIQSELKIKDLFKAMEEGRVEEFGAILQEFIANAVSFYDFNKNEPEKSYHLFVLGMLVSLEGVYTIKSNRESGYGRYDIMLIPQDKKRPGVIIEFKKVFKQTVQEAADAALAQIATKHYAAELRAAGVRTIRSYGIAFEGKELFVKMQS